MKISYEKFRSEVRWRVLSSALLCPLWAHRWIKGDAFGLKDDPVWSILVLMTAAVHLCYVVVLLRYTPALFSEQRMKRLYYRHCDERAAAIRAKSGGEVTLAMGVLLTLVAAFVEDSSITIAMTLLLMGVVEIAVCLGLRLYHTMRL